VRMARRNWGLWDGRDRVSRFGHVRPIGTLSYSSLIWIFNYRILLDGIVKAYKDLHRNRGYPGVLKPTSTKSKSLLKCLMGPIFVKSRRSSQHVMVLIELVIFLRSQTRSKLAKESQNMHGIYVYQVSHVIGDALRTTV
jgi:hypothetical protein